MVKDAELNAEEDKKIVELVQARNSLDGSITNLENQITNLEGYLPEEEKTKILDALTKYKETAKGDSKEDMDKGVEELGNLYRETIKYEAEKRNKEMPNGDPNAEVKPGDPTVVDAEVKEAKETN